MKLTLLLRVSFCFALQISETKETKTHPKDKYHVLLQLVNADKESKFAKNFYYCIKSILTRTNLTLNFHLTVDSTSKETAESILGKIKQELRLHETPQVSYYLAAELNKKIYEYTKTLQVMTLFRKMMTFLCGA